MKTQEILKVALKYTGIMFGFDAFTRLLNLIVILTRQNPNNVPINIALFETSSPFFVPIQVFLFVFYAFVSWYLIANTDKVSSMFIKDSKDTNTSKENLLELAMLFNGLGLLVYGIPKLFTSLFQQLFFAENLSRAFTNVTVMTSIFEIIIGILIVSKAGKISKWLLKKLPYSFWQ